MNDTTDVLICKMWAFLTDHVFRRRIVRVQGNSSIRICYDQICAVHATSSSLRGRRETCTLTRSGSFRVFANQESRKRIGHRQHWTFIRSALRDDGRSQCRAWKFAIAQSAVVQSDRDKYCPCMPHTKAALACDIGFHSKLCISPLCRVFCQRVCSLPRHLAGVYSGILSAIAVHAKFRRAFCPLLVIPFAAPRFTIILALVVVAYIIPRLYCISSITQPRSQAMFCDFKHVIWKILNNYFFFISLSFVSLHLFKISSFI